MRVVAKWEANRGKQFLVLLCDEIGYTYKTLNGGGNLGKLANDQQAIERVLRPWGRDTGAVTILRSDYPSVKRVK